VVVAGRRRLAEAAPGRSDQRPESPLRPRPAGAGVLAFRNPSVQTGRAVELLQRR